MNITLNEKEKNCVTHLLSQEKLCIEKYEKYASMAKDTVLKDLFTMIKSDEEKHLSSLNDLMNGTVSTNVNVNDNAGATYSPAATYTLSVLYRRFFPLCQKEISSPPSDRTVPQNISEQKGCCRRSEN